MRKGAYETQVYLKAYADAGYPVTEIEKRKEEIFQTLFYGSEE